MKEEFFSQDHNRLLSIAVWAKWLAWVVLVVYVLSTGGMVFKFQNTENYSAILSNRPTQDLMDLLINNPLKAFNLGVDMAATLLKGIVYYLVLKGISLGLNMIVETDINYREKKGGQDE
jgi:hypothetical protein